jgi:hypothetical protein
VQQRLPSIVACLSATTLLAGCVDSEQVAQSVLDAIFGTQNSVSVVEARRGDGCLSASFVPDGAKFEELVEALSLQLFPSVAYAQEQLLLSEDTASSATDARFTIGLARNCFESREEFHELVELTPSYVGFWNYGHEIIVLPRDGDGLGYLLVGYN